MLENYSNMLSRVENIAQLSLKKNNFNTYLIYGNLLINSTLRKNSPLLKNNEIQFLPNINLKHWVLWFLSKLKIKNNKITLRSLLGFYLCRPFLKKTQLPLNTDIIFYRFHNAIMLYDFLEKGKVLKVALSDWGKVKINIEREVLHNISKFKHHKVKVPLIILDNDDVDANFFVQDFFEGNQLTIKDDLSEVFELVFDFLKKFYVSDGIELKSIYENPFLNHTFVEDYIISQKGGKEVVEIYKRLLRKDKRMLWGWVHGDLSHHNILYNQDQICIIDWGKSKKNYLAVDLDITNFRTNDVFDAIIYESGIDKESIYTLNEQIFIKRFAEVNRLVHNGIKRKTLSNTFYKWVENQNEILLSIEI
jgi:serine/threonine protein kinase